MGFSCLPPCSSASRPPFSRPSIQSICASIAPLAAGSGWISFRAWAMYFLGGARALIGYGIGMAASIAMIFCDGRLGALGFWAMPLVPIILYLDIAPEMVNEERPSAAALGRFYCRFPSRAFTEAISDEERSTSLAAP